MGGILGQKTRQNLAGESYGAYLWLVVIARTGATQKRPLSVFRPQDKYARLARENINRALASARTERSSFLQCFAAASIAACCPPDYWSTALKQACDAAAAGDDDFKRAAYLAMPLAVAVDMKRTGVAEQILEKALLPLRRIEHSGTRAFAMAELFRASIDGQPRLWVQVVAAIEENCTATSHWRAKRLHRHVMYALARIEPESAAAFAARQPDERFRRRLLKDLESVPPSSA